MEHRTASLDQTERRRIAGLARNPKCRDREFQIGRPTVWQPVHTTSEAGFPFTEPGAWDFIATHIESGGVVYTIELDKPPGARGYVIFYPPVGKWRGLYIKFELKGRGIYGRSFHHPDFPTIKVET